MPQKSQQGPDHLGKLEELEQTLNDLHKSGDISQDVFEEKSRELKQAKASIDQCKVFHTIIESPESKPYLKNIRSFAKSDCNKFRQYLSSLGHQMDLLEKIAAKLFAQVSSQDTFGYYQKIEKRLIDSAHRQKVNRQRNLKNNGDQQSLAKKATLLQNYHLKRLDLFKAAATGLSAIEAPEEIGQTKSRWWHLILKRPSLRELEKLEFEQFEGQKTKLAQIRKFVTENSH